MRLASRRKDFSLNYLAISVFPFILILYRFVSELAQFYCNGIGFSSSIIAFTSSALFFDT